MLDSLTDLAAKYLQVLCEKTASNAINNHGDAADYSVVDIRLALQEAGALAPERLATEQDWIGEEDTRGVDEFLEWFSGQRMKELMEIGSGDGEADATDYLNGMRDPIHIVPPGRASAFLAKKTSCDAPRSREANLFFPSST